MFGFSDEPSYDSGAKFGQTFRSLMQSVKEAFESAYPGTKQLKNIRKFSVPVKGSSTFLHFSSLPSERN